MLLIQTLLTISILVLFFLRFRIGLCAYIAYMFLVPYCSLNVGGVPFSWNLINSVLLIAYCFDCTRKCGRIHFAYKPFIPFFLLYGLLLLEMLFQYGVPLGYAMTSWRLAVFDLILPIVVMSVSQYDNKIVEYSFVTMIFVSIVIALYAFFLVPLKGINPYVMELANANNAELMDAQFGEQTGRLMIKISSVFTHPMTFGAFLGMALIYACSQWTNSKSIILLVTILGLFSCIFVCGIRTPIAALFVTIIVYLLLKKNLNAFISVLVLGIACFYIINQIPELAGTISSMFDSTSSKVGGSSIELRLAQLDAAFDEVHDCMIFGQGFGYNSYYLSVHGAHPRLYAFESLIFVILCNYGLVGFFIWGLMFYMLYNNANKIIFSTGMYIIMLIAYYISYTCITGEYGYIKYFIFFYSLLIIDAYPQYKNSAKY